MTSESGAAPSLGFRLAVGALFLAYLGAACYFAEIGRLNQDEGWYLYASRLVYEGRLPYRDFAFFQAPFLPYVYGLPQLPVEQRQSARVG